MIEEVRFNLDGLVSVIAQDAHDGTILMLAWANKEALEETLRTGFGTYFSRSRQKLWRKGEESGNRQKIFEILLDCDGDSVIYKVEQKEILPVTPAIEAAFTAAGTVKTGKRMLLS